MLETPGRPVLLVATVGQTFGYTYTQDVTRRQALDMVAALRLAADDLERAAKS